MTENWTLIVVAGIAALASILSAWLSHRTHMVVNGRVIRLLEESRQAGRIEGVAAEKADEARRRR